MPFQSSSLDPSARCRYANTELRQLSAMMSPQILRKLFRSVAGRGGCTVVEGCQPLDDRVPVTGLALVVDQRGMQVLEHAVHATRPFGDGGELLHADEIAADAEDDRVAARQAPQALQLDAQMHEIAGILRGHG